MGMFSFIKEKLGIFKQKVSEEVEKEEAPPALTPAEAKHEEIQQAAQAQAAAPEESKKEQAQAIVPESQQAAPPPEQKTASPIQQPAPQEKPKTPEFKVEEGGFFGVKLSDDKLDELIWDLEVALMESDVAMPVIDEIKAALKGQLSGKKVKRREVDGIVENALRFAIEHALSSKKVDFMDFVRNAPKPAVIMFVGVNGTGKTTSIARIGYLLQNNGIPYVLAAGDTFRAGAIEQLDQHAQRLGAKIIKHKAGSDPAAVAYDAIEYAKAHHKDVVLLDTAGRMQTNKNLMDEMKKIKRVSNPAMMVFVGDALAGNDAIEQARAFNEAVGIDCAILTKIDADAKGGAALSIAHTIGKPIIFVGMGQGYGDLIPFDAKWMVERLFGNN